MILSEVVTLLGTQLSRSIHKPVLVCKGLVRLAFKDAGLDLLLSQNALELLEINFVIENHLKQRLEKLRIENVDEIVASLSLDMTRSQVILTMSR
jgi:hypothetical protein